MEYEIKARWVHDWQFVATDARGHSLAMDSPKMEEDSGFSPMELHCGFNS